MSGRFRGGGAPRGRANNRPRSTKPVGGGPPGRRRSSRSRSRERIARRESRERREPREHRRRSISPLMRRTSFRRSNERLNSPIVLHDSRSRSVSRERCFEGREQRNMYSPSHSYRENERLQLEMIDRNKSLMQFSPPRREEDEDIRRGQFEQDLHLENEARKLIFEPPVAPSFEYGNSINLQSESMTWRAPDSKPAAMLVEPSNNWGKHSEPEQPESWSNHGSVQNFISVEEGHPDIPMFDNTNPDMTARQWVGLIDTLGNKSQWSPEDKKFQFASKLTNAPKEWYLREDKILEDWTKLKRSFIRMFRNDMDYYYCLTKMFARVKSESETFSNYFTHKTLLLKQCGLTGRKAVSCLIGGLTQDKYKMNLAFDQNFATPELLYTFLTTPEEIKKAENFVNESKFCQGCGKSGHIIGSCPTGGRPAAVAEKKANINTSSTRFINPRYLLDVIVNGHALQGYSDNQSQCVTMREDHTFPAKLIHNRQKRTIIGFGGASITALGDANVLIRVGNAVVNMQVFIVPNSTQDVPVVIGHSFRKHPDVIYVEDMQGIHFNQKGYQPPQNSSFSMNEKLIQKMNDIRNVTPGYTLDAPMVDKNPPMYKSSAGPEKRSGKEYFNPFNYQARNESRNQFSKFQ